MNMSEPKWFHEINMSSTAFAEDDPSASRHFPSRVKKRSSSTDHDVTEGMSEFGDMRLDGIVRADRYRKRRQAVAINRMYCVMCAAIAVVAITTLSVMVPKSTSESHSFNAYEERVDDIHDAFVELGISNEIDSLTPGSPQYEAMHWIAVHPGSLSQDVASYAFIARYVMALTFFALGVPLPTIDLSICEWLQKDDNVKSGIQCNEEEHPISLNFAQLGLLGQIPSEFGLLTTVQHLNLAKNALEGSIPSELCKLSQLKTLNLSFNKIKGTVPNCMGTMESLQTLNLNFNQMTGSLPEGGFQNLRQMYLNLNRFSMALPNLVSSMQKLEELSARGNQLYGEIDLAFDHLAENLVLLDLTGNRNLGGEFPNMLLHNAPNLEVLALGNNAVTGKLTWSIPQHERLRYLSINNNDMEGMIPPSIANLTALTHFIASDNRFTGPMPALLPSGIKSLFLSDNNFSPGPIPEAWASLKDMKAFHGKGCSRTGNLPMWIGPNWAELEVLDVSRNDLQGNIPYSLGQLTKLEYLFLSENQRLSGYLPASFNSLTSLKQILLFQTDISGNWEFMCNILGSDTAILGTYLEGCSCCVLCDDRECARDFLNGIDATFEEKYRSYWVV